MERVIKILCLFFLLVFINPEIKSAPFDTGMITFYQPDETHFTGRIWGDEFFYWAETEEGYRFVHGEDGWFYFAQLDDNGEFAPTEYKVGIDEPPSESYQLERSQDRIDEINQLVEEFKNKIELNRQWYAQKQAEADAEERPVTLSVGIILIEFTDSTHYEGENRPDGYFIADFDSMMFSYNYWIGTGINSPHPEEEEVFGSFRDYYDQMSRGKLVIEGRVVNPTYENGVPEWLMADTTRGFYRNVNVNTQWDTLADEAITKALNLEWIDTTDPGNENYYDNLIIIYAGSAIFGGALSVVGGRGIGSNWIFLAERSGPSLYGSNQEKSFTHMGIYAHEFGHNLGFDDEYYNPPAPTEYGNGTSIFNFCLMAMGIYNGPDRKGACPASLSPYYRLEKNWVSSTTLNSDHNNFIVAYNYSNPNLYRINPIEALGNEHYLIETKKREGFDLYIPGSPADTINQPGRLLIWHHDIDPSPYSGPDTDRVLIKPADNIFDDETQITDFFPAQFNPNKQDLNDITIPQATLGKIYFYNPLITNESPAHFALNGIQKLANGNTLIEEIRLNHQFITNQNSGGWQTVSVPVGLYDYTRSSVFPTSISAYRYIVNTYVQVDTLANDPGYWVNFPSQPQTINLGGVPIDSLVIPVYNGWNITGSIFYKIPIPNVCSDPPGIIDKIYKYNNGYILMTANDTLIPGIGYWTNTKDSGNIILDRFAEPCELEKITSMPQINFSELDKFIITDADGYSQSLYVSNIDIDTLMANLNLDLPPFFSELNFDSRFEYNEFVKKVSADSGTIDLNILVHTNSYPLTLAWELNPDNGLNYSFIGDTIIGKISNIETVKGKATFNQLENNKIRMWSSIGKSNLKPNLPTEFALEQNYPNPFNPITQIRYSIPEKEFVTLKIFDILGKEITKLVNGEKSAGTYSVSFDASNLASGIYFYSISAGNFHQTKKMTLLR